MIIKAQNIPNELKSRDQWLVWKYQTQKRNGKTRTTKPPYNPVTHKKENDNNTYHSFEIAIKALQNSEHHYDGIGFKFKEGDGITGIDIDHCIFNTGGESNGYKPLAKKIRDRFRNTYCEVSPSGEGIRIFVKGKAVRCGKGTVVKEVEIYDHTSPRYLTVTGNHIEGTGMSVIELPEALQWLHDTYFATSQTFVPGPTKKIPEPTQTTSKNTRSVPTKTTSTQVLTHKTLSDDDILKLCKKAKNANKFEALWNGGGDSDQSRGDLALCSILAFYTQSTGGEGELQLDRLFRQSARMRDKWDTPHSSDKRTYGQITIEKTLRNLRNTFIPRSNTPPIQNLTTSVPSPVSSEPTAPTKTTTPTPISTSVQASYYYQTTSKDGNVTLKLVEQSVARNRFIQNGCAKGLAYNAFTEDWYRYQNGLWKCTSKDIVIQQLDHTINKDLQGKLGYSQNWISGVFKLLQNPLATEEWDTQASYFVPFKNGILNLQTKAFFEHREEYRFTWQLPYNYNPQATCQPIIDWLHESVNGDTNQVDVLRAFLQAVLTGRYDLERYVEIIGEGGSGKSTFSWLCQALVGSENTRATDFKTLETNRFEMSSFYGKRLIVLTDEDKFAGQIGNFKKITGGDPLRYEDKHRSVRGDKSRDFVFKGMVLVIANQAIKSSDYTSGLARRRLTFYFKNQPTTIRQLKGKHGEFYPLLPGLVNWVLAMPVQQVDHLLREGDKLINSLVTTRLDNLESTNPIFGWLQDNCAYDSEGFTPIGGKKLIRMSEGNSGGDLGTSTQSYTEYVNQNIELFPNYCAWCEYNGKQPVSLNDFSKLLEDLCQRQLGLRDVQKIRKYINDKQNRGFKGLILSTEVSFAESAKLITNENNIEYELNI